VRCPEENLLGTAAAGFSTSLNLEALPMLKGFGSAGPKVRYSEACVPKLVYKLAEACYISVTGTNPNPKP